MKHKYGEFTENQIKQTKEFMRKQIYFLILIVDPNTCEEYEDINVENVFDITMTKIAGLSSLLNSPVEIVTILSLLESAKIEYEKDDFNWKIYRKLVFDAGSEVLKIKEV